MWKNMAPEEKEPYIHMSEEDHSRYSTQQEEEMTLRRDNGIPAIKKTRGRR